MPMHCTFASYRENGSSESDSGHSAESPIDISDDGSEPSEHGDSGKEGESIDCDEDVDEFESDGGHSSGAAMAKHRAEMQSNEGRGIRVKRSGVKTCIGSPPTKKRTLYSTYHLMVRRLSPNVPFDGEEDGAGHGAEVAMLEYNDSVTGEAEHSEQTPVDEDCEAEVEANK
nr:uncharacterized protein LOC109149060 isoform X10 [Ipomoea trifida]